MKKPTANPSLAPQSNLESEGKGSSALEIQRQGHLSTEWCLAKSPWS